MIWGQEKLKTKLRPKKRVGLGETGPGAREIQRNDRGRGAKRQRSN